MSGLVHIEGAPRPRTSAREIVRIGTNLAVVCGLGASVLGALYLVTERSQAAARLAGERAAIAGMLELPAGASVLEVRQGLDAAHREVVYHASRYGEAGAPVRTLAFGLDGAPHAAVADSSARLEDLGRFFVARTPAGLAGFVVEGLARGYKNRIRFFVALDSAFTVTAVRVLEHEEDPGLGAEVATPLFLGQFAGRRAPQTAALEVTRAPMPEDWRAALVELAGSSRTAWQAGHAELVRREAERPIYAVTGATISSRALTGGVRTTVEHFRRRWALLAPGLQGTP